MHGTERRANRRSGRWSLLTPHGHVLARISSSPTIRIRDLATGIGMTERAVHRIVSDLEEAGLVSHEKVGRRKHYEVHLDRSPTNDIETDLDLARVVAVVADTLQEDNP